MSETRLRRQIGVLDRRYTGHFSLSLGLQLDLTGVNDKECLEVPQLRSSVGYVVNAPFVVQNSKGREARL